MAINPCSTYTYDGKTYSYAEFKTKLAEGLLDELKSKGHIIDKGSQEENTSLKKSMQRDLPDIKINKLGEDSGNLMKGKKAIESGDIVPHEIVDKIIKGEGEVGRTLTEDHAMQYYGRQLENRSIELNSELSDAEERLSKNPDNEEAIADVAILNDLLKQHNDDYEAFQVSNAYDSNYWGKKGLIKQVEIAPDFTIAQTKEHFRKGYGGEIPKEVEKILEDAVKERDKAKADLNKLQKEYDEWKAKSEVEKAKVSRNKGIRKSHEEYVKERKDLFESIGAKLKKSSSQLSGSFIPYADKLIEISPEVAKIVKSLVEEGVDKLEDIVKVIHEEIKKHIPDVTEKDVKDVIAGKYKEEKELTEDQLTKKDINEKINQVKREAAKLSPLEEAAKKEENRLSSAIKASERNIADIERKLKDKVLTTEKKPKIESTELDVLREKAKTLREEYNKFKKENISPLEEARKKLDAEERRLNNIIKNKKFITPEKPKYVFPKADEITKAQTRIALAKRKIKEQRVKMENSNAAKTQKVLNFISRWNRRTILSGIKILGKLSGAALYNYGSYIPEELAGHFFGKLFSKIAEDSEGEAYINAKAVAKFYTEPFRLQRLKDAANIIKTGSTELSKAKGEKFYQHYAGLDLLTDMHTLIKMFPHASEYAASLEKMTVEAEKQGYDIGDPVIQQALQLKAFKKANYSIFLNDNKLTKRYEEFVRGLDSKNDVKVAKFISDMLIPVSKVPANIASRSLTYLTGLPTGLIKVANMYRKGVEKFTPEEKAAVMRQLKKGSLGGALLVSSIIMGSKNTGLFNPTYSDKRKMSGDKSGQLSFLGFKLPHELQHSPQMQALLLAGMFGMSIKEYYKHPPKKGEARPKHNLENNVISIAEAAAQTVTGLASKVPVLHTPAEYVGAISGNEEAKRNIIKDWKYRAKVPLIEDIKDLSK